MSTTSYKHGYNDTMEQAAIGNYDVDTAIASFDNDPADSPFQEGF